MSRMSNAYMAEYLLKRYTRRKSEALASLGGACKECGATTDLEFHHVDPATKLFAITKALATRAEAALRAELAKCILLCEPCHSKRHASTAPCGTMARYARGCRCAECRAENAEYSRPYNAARDLRRAAARESNTHP